MSETYRKIMHWMNTILSHDATGAEHQPNLKVNKLKKAENYKADDCFLSVCSAKCILRN